MTDARYLVFAGRRYYPRGGWSDFQGAFASEPEAMTHAETHDDGLPFDWWHIVDMQTRQVVREWDRNDE